MSDNPNFIVRVMSDKRNPAQPTIHVGYADSGLTDTPHIRHQFRQSPHLSVKPDFTVVLLLLLHHRLQNNTMMNIESSHIMY